MTSCPRVDVMPVCVDVMPEYIDVMPDLIGHLMIQRLPVEPAMTRKAKERLPVEPAMTI